MKFKFTLPVLFLAIVFLTFSCKQEKKTAPDAPDTEIQTEQTKGELRAEVLHQCPMDCEDGKTYEEAGSCPVCGMDLKPVSKETAMTCKMHADGKCTCDKEDCSCKNCKEHSKG